MNQTSSAKPITVAVLDDHQVVLDGYAYRLADHPDIRIVLTAQNGAELHARLKLQAADLLLLDVSVPVSETDSNPIPLLHFIPNLRESYPEMAILVISMHKESTLIRSVMEAGAKGYIIKDDHDSIVNLGDIIQSVATGGVYFSKQSYGMLTGEQQSEQTFVMPTKRQLEALSLCASSPGASVEQLAPKLNIAPSTLRNLLSNCYMRLQVRNRAAAVERARQLGLITPFPSNPNLT